jgi:hypothetical protein
MMNKIRILPTGLALAITVALFYALCALASALWPDGTIAFFNAWMHSVDLKAIEATRPMTLGLFVYGLISIALVGFIVGIVYAWVYNRMDSLSRAAE